MRVAIAIIFLWIGGLKFVPYEADSITPFVANNPVMSLFYEHPDQYAQHLTRDIEADERLVAEMKAKAGPLEPVPQYPRRLELSPPGARYSMHIIRCTSGAAAP